MQIAERKKLVSSINNAVNDAGSLRKGDGSFSSLESAEDGSDTYEERYAPDFQSGGSHNVSVGESQEDQPSTTSEDFDEDAIQNGKGFFQNSAEHGSANQVINVPSGQVYHHELPSFLSASPSSTSKYENYENLKDSCVEEPYQEAKHEYVKTPPLAGANVMNVILVAAECAPWSKTGKFLINSLDGQFGTWQFSKQYLIICS